MHHLAFLRFRVMLWMLAFLQPILLFAQLRSGPMVGHCAMREATIWLQTDGTKEVDVIFWPSSNPKARQSCGKQTSEAKSTYVLKFTAALLEPGTEYIYQIVVGGKPVAISYPLTFKTPALWQHRTDPPAFSFLAGSCVYVNEEAYDRPGTPYGGDHRIFTTMNSEYADLMLWLGDNTYLREADWDSRSGIMHRYTHSRSLAEATPLLGRMANYAIWDDHDHGPNDSDYSYPLRDVTLEAFNLFWANPSTGQAGQGGITSAFTWLDCAFFLMDDRWFRSAPDSAGQILGDAQINWLIAALKASNATFKFVCVGGQILNDAPVYENMAVFVQERRKLLARIDQTGIKNIVFLTGDRHYSEVSRWQGPLGTVVHDFTISPLTSKASEKAKNEVNHHQVDGSFVMQRNYGLISISGKRKERVLKLDLKDVDGKPLYSFSLPAL